MAREKKETTVVSEKQDMIEPEKTVLENEFSVLKKRVDGYCAVLRKLKTEAERHWGVDIDGDGNVGSIKTFMPVLILVVCMAGFVVARDVISWGSTQIGTAKVTTDDAGTATLTVDAIAGPLSGAVAATTLSASGVTTLSEDVVVSLDATDEEVRINHVTNTVNMLIISNSAAEVTGPTMGIRIKYADDGETDADFISCEDNGGDVKFSVGDSGNTVVAGTLNVTGVITTSGDVNNDATGGSTGDPDFDVDGYAKFNGIVEFDAAIDADSTLDVANTATFAGAIIGNSTLFITNGATIGGTLTQNDTLTMAAGKEVVIDGKYATVGSDATTGLMIDRGTCTNGQSVVTFGAVFGAGPSVVVGWSDDVSAYSALTNTCISATVNTTNFVPLTAVPVGDLVNMYWIAIGTRP